MGKRLTYEPADYARQQHRLEQILAGCTPLSLSSADHHVTPPPAGTRITYLSQLDMACFEEVAHFDSRSIKLINYGRPATRLHFLVRHKYQIRKNLPASDVLRLTSELILQLRESGSESAKSIALLEHVQQAPGRFEVALSNYHQGYSYPYICYRHGDGRGYSTANTHLTKQHNVLFVDLAEITQTQAPRDDDQAREYLSSFASQFDLGKHRLLIKPL